MARSLFLLLLMSGPLLARPDSRLIHERQSAVQGLPGYEVEARYPVFGRGVSPRVNQVCLSLLQQDLARFRSNYQQLSSGGFPWSYQARFSLEANTPQLLSVLYTVTAREDGAHPRFYFLCAAFQPQSGQPWRFQPSWLKPLSRYCIDDLKKQIHPKFGDAGDAEIERGAGPRLENFSCVLPTARGLKVYFRTDQVGSNLLGTRIVDVPQGVLGK